MFIDDTHISVLDGDGNEILIEVPKTPSPQVIVEFENEDVFMKRIIHKIHIYWMSMKLKIHRILYKNRKVIFYSDGSYKDLW